LATPQKISYCRKAILLPGGVINVLIQLFTNVNAFFACIYALPGTKLAFPAVIIQTLRVI